MNKQAERRSSLRRPVYHEALMKVDEELILNCIITDFCLDGMFIKFMSESAKRLVDLPEIDSQNMQVALSFIGDQGQDYSISAEIVHHLQGACGLRFLKRYDSAVQSLVNISAKIGQSTDHSLPVKTILNECIQFINNTFGPLLNDFWVSLEGELRAEAVKASNDQSANSLMALAEKVKQKQNSFQKGVLNAIEDPIAAFNAHLEKRKLMSDRLSLIDKNEFEDWLVSRVLVMRCEADYQALLMPLKLRFDALGVGDKRHHQSVFGPALLVSAFQPVVQNLIVDNSTEKLIFRVFEQKVMLSLKGLYEGLNAILIRHNILPQLNVKQSALSKNVVSKRPSKQANSSNGERGDKRPHNQEATTITNQHTHNQNYTVQNRSNFSAETSTSFTLPPFSMLDQGDMASNRFSENQHAAQTALSNITNLLRSLRGESSQSPHLEEEKLHESYSTEEFDQGLSVLQASSTTTEWLESPKSLMERVQENLFKSGSEKVIDDNKKAAIDVVDRFFLSMRNNPRISSEAKQYLLKLEVPVLKVLLKDDRFFEDQQSSVRAVMNRIAQLGAKGANLNPASRDKVSKLVERVIDEFENDTTVFDTVLSELDQLIDRQNSLYVKNVERVAAAADGTQKVEDANLAVTKAINERIAHKFVPSALITLINEGWKEFLHLTYIKFGERSEQWNEALSVVDRLIAYGDDPRMPIDIKVILPKIQDGLKLVSGNNEASVTVRDALKAFILNAPKGMHLSEQAQQLQLPETEENLLSQNLHKSQELKNWIVKIKTISLGSWMKFNKQENEVIYMRLVWVAKGFSKFVFVNHQGMKVIELGLFKLANYFKDARIEVDPVYELPIVNQGLDDMVKDVYDKLAYASSHDLRTGLINKSEFCRQVRVVMKKGKRTSACSLLFIHFRDSSEAELKLTEIFANQVVKTLEALSSVDAIFARVSETDFVIFNVVNDPLSYKSSCQSALIGLCQMPDNIDSGLMVTVGESRAHLGFNNPESMIEHACQSIKIPSSNSKNLAQDSIENKAPPSVDIDNQSSDAIIIDEAANAAMDTKSFAGLKFEIWGQETSEIIQEAIENESTQARSTLKTSVHINLHCVIQGDVQTYSPENEECAIQLDEWWIQKLIYLQQFEAQLFEDYQKVRIKLSAYAFNKDDVIEKLVSLAHSGELKADQVCFDIYDSFLIEDVEFAAIRMNRLKNTGYSFCLDHFGSDRSPFSYLKALPVDMIKIDEVFISVLNEAEDTDEAAADSIVEIAHYMGKRVLATGVDSAVCLQKMKRLKVDFVQGSTISSIQKYEF